MNLPPDTCPNCGEPLGQVLPDGRHALTGVEVLPSGEVIVMLKPCPYKPRRSDRNGKGNRRA